MAKGYRRQRQPNRQRGYVLLEMVPAIIALLLGLLAVFDLSRLLTAYAALREASTFGARQLSALAGSAVQAARPDSRPVYSWRRIDWDDTVDPPKRRSRPVGETTDPEPPSECRIEGGYCERGYVGHSGGSQTIDRVWSNDRVQYLVENELRTLFPDARSGCSTKGCYSIRFSAVPEGVPTPEAVELRVTYRLPLVLLGTGTVELSASARTPIESTFLRNDVLILQDDLRSR